MSTIFIIGAGPKIGLQVPKLFLSKGFTSVGLASRSKANLETLAAQLPQGTKYAIAPGTDANDLDSLIRGLDSLKQSLGKPDVVVYNASSLFLEKRLLKDMTVELFEAHLRVTLTAGFVTGQWALNHLNQSGVLPPAVIYTGGSLAHNPRPTLAGLAVGKAGLLNLTKAFRGENSDIHWATVTVTGLVDGPDPKYAASAIAEDYWKLYQQLKSDWQIEVIH